MLTSSPASVPAGPQFPAGTDPQFAAAETSAREHAARVAMGEEPASIVLRGGRVVDVFDRRVVRADVAIAGQRIAAVGDVAASIGDRTIVIDCAGRFIAPGFIEPHYHVGGSQVTIERLAELLLPLGTTVLGTCFYEAAIISGVEAVEDQLRRVEHTGLDVLLAPFVASVGQGDLGASRSDLADVRRLIAHPRAIELREWNYASHIPALRDAYVEALTRGRVIGGHMEGLTGAPLQAAAALGCRSDHETGSVEEALAKVRAGITVQIREGTGARDLTEVTRAITEFGADPVNFALTADQQELWSLADRGHLDDKLRRVVAEGVGPVDAVRMATLAAARSLGIADRYGAIAPGRFASLCVLGDLREFEVHHVLSRGAHVVADGHYTVPTDFEPYPAEYRETLRVGGTFDAADMRLPALAGRVRVVGITAGSLLTEELEEDVDLPDGVPDPATGLNLFAVMDRHEASGRLGVGLVRGVGVTSGAFAATPVPGQVDPMVVGTDPEDMALAARRMLDLGGGIVVVRDGTVLAEVALPVFGLLDDGPLDETIAACRAVARAIAEIGCPDPDVVSNTAFATLPRSLPRLKLTSHGLVRVFREGPRELVPLMIAASGR